MSEPCVVWEGLAPNGGRFPEGAKLRLVQAPLSYTTERTTVFVAEALRKDAMGQPAWEHVGYVCGDVTQDDTASRNVLALLEVMLYQRGSERS